MTIHSEGHTTTILADLAAEYGPRWAKVVPTPLIEHLKARGTPVWTTKDARRWLLVAAPSDYRPAGRALASLRAALRLNQRDATKVLRMSPIGVLENSQQLPHLASHRLRIAIIVAAAFSLPAETTS